MNNIGHYLIWQNFNLAIPMIGLLLAAWMFFSNKTCTAKKSVSSQVVFFGLTWLVLTWADFGSATFIPSRQTYIARLLILITMIMSALYARSNTTESTKMRSEIKMLKIKLAAMQQYINEQKGRRDHE